MQSSQEPVVAIIIFLCLAALLYFTLSLIYDWFKDKKKSSTSMEEDKNTKSPWSLGDAVKFGFGFGMGMFLWAIFAMVVGAFIIIFLFSGGASTISNFFAPSNTQINSSAGY